MEGASRSEPVPAARRSRADLLDKLAESKQLMKHSATAFDRGFEAEANRLAVVLRVLFHDTGHAHSLLQQLDAKDRLYYVDTAPLIDPRNLAPTPGLVIMKVTWRTDGSSGEYVAPLDMPRPHGIKLRPFVEWWERPVIKVDRTWSRKELVLALAHKEGGAHVDPLLDETYEALAKRNGVGWVGYSDGEPHPFTGNVVAAAVRQVAHEALESLARQADLLS